MRRAGHSIISKFSTGSQGRAFIMTLELVLTPHGLLTLRQTGKALASESEQGLRLEKAFIRGSGHGLLRLGADEVGTALPPVLSYWRELGVRYVTALCALPGVGDGRTKPPVPIPADGELDKMAAAVPPMTGAEYLTAAVLADLWRGMDATFEVELADANISVQAFLKGRHPAWNLVGRVHFNLAENRKDEDAPFAFLATYTTRLSAHAKAQDLPLVQALGEYAGAANKDRLWWLLLPVQRAAANCPWLKTMVDEGEIFHPLRWSPHEATRMLRDVPQLESAGVVVRMPAAWKANRPSRPQVTAQVGGSAPSQLGQNALLDFRMEVVLNGETLTAVEVKQLLAESDGLALVRGRWVEVDRERLKRMIEHFGEVERTAAETGLAFGEAMRMLAGANVPAGEDTGDVEPDWAQEVAGPWLAETLKGLRSHQGLQQIDAGAALNGTLRPYQQVGLRWVYLLAK